MTSLVWRAGFELVNYLKKFILAGFLVFVDPGSATQLQPGAVVSAAAPGVVDVVVAQPLPVDAVVLEAKS